jgi:aspartate-semialdehyde dehydrogenase
METRMLRAAIVGASTLLGKELAETLAEATTPGWELTLLDDEAASGLMTAAGDEAMLIQTLAPGAFAGVDVVFFAAGETTTRTHWKEARGAGAAIVDLTGALEGGEGIPVMSPWVEGARMPDLTTVAVVPANPAAVMLALLATRLRAGVGAVKMVATVLQPASQHGKAGLDELHAQTAALLSFQGVPRDVYDAQVAFNLLVELGADAKVSLAEDREQMRRQFAALAGGLELELQLVQAPVFNGYTASVFVEFEAKVAGAAVGKALDGGVVRVVAEGDEAVSNQDVTEQAEVIVSVADAGEERRGFWVWAAADNLRLAALNAAACAAELARLRPAGKVQ